MTLRNLFVLVLLLSSGYSMAAEEKTIYGYVEKATLVDKGMLLSAKFDTGAKSASLSAVDIHEIEENGKPYLRFKVPGKQEEVEFISPYVGRVKIKLRTGENPSDQQTHSKRPVVMMPIKIGDKVRNIRVNLTNRKRFNYPLLLGRDAIIAFNGMVDPGITFNLRAQQVEKK